MHTSDVKIGTFLYSKKDNYSQHAAFGVELLPKFDRSEKVDLSKSVLLIKIRPKGRIVHLHFDLTKNGKIIDKHPEYSFE